MIAPVQQDETEGENPESDGEDRYDLAVQTRHDLLDLRAARFFGRLLSGDLLAGEGDRVGVGGEAEDVGLGARLAAEVVEPGARERDAVGRDQVGVLVFARDLAGERLTDLVRRRVRDV